jgi:hypothetical protein
LDWHFYGGFEEYKILHRKIITAWGKTRLESATLLIYDMTFDGLSRSILNVMC